MFAGFIRILVFAVRDFSRNKGISVAAIFVLVITIMLLTGLFFFHGAIGYLTSQVRDKIDIAAYFKDGTQEEEILGVKDEILKMSPDIKSIEYVSKEQALAFFNERHKDNPVLARALEEVGNNPFLPSLNIATSGDPKQYESISNVLQTSDFSKFIEKVDFSQKKDTIEKVYSITSYINTSGLVLGFILICIAVLIIYNTIGLTIESSKEEISTMKIVGASDRFVKGPFVAQGIIYGSVAFLICILLSLVLAYFLSPEISVILPGFSMLEYFLTNWWILVLIQLGFGVGVGAISALIVIRKHLEV